MPNNNFFFIKCCTLLLMLGISFTGFGQTTFSDQQIISTEVDYTSSIDIVDIDGDGDMDVLSASWQDDKIAWYENVDGFGTFGPQHILSNQASSAGSVEGADIDGDGDIDVVGTYASSAIWYENLDGLGNFGSGQIISDQIWRTDISAADLNGDGNLDILSIIVSPTVQGKMVWQENENGLGSFGEQQLFTTEYDYLDAFYTVDIDNDGDIDVVGTEGTTFDMFWYENEDGLGNFSAPQTISSELDGPGSPFSSDLDGDGDMDVLAVSTVGNEIVWFENQDGLGNFSSKKIISNLVAGPISVFAADFDNDSDIDIVGAYDNKVVWYENEDGLGNFGEQSVIVTTTFNYPRVVYAADMDDDGDLDVLSGETSFISWYENFLNSPQLSGTCYYDQNENKIKDPDEVGLLNHAISLSPNEGAYFTNSDGNFRFFVDNGTYTLGSQPISNWVLTTDSSSYTINLQDTIVQNLDFGMKPIVEMTRVVTTTASGPTRCGFEVPFWINYQNTGTTFATGYVTFELDDLTSLVSANPMPDSIDGNILFWNYQNLAPSYSEDISLVLQMPGVDFLGEDLYFYTTPYAENAMGELQPLAVYRYISTVNCAYDPNDKQVSPQGVQEEQYTLFGEELEYTVRFQNTGTDTAFTVRIEDQLDDDLDWNSFRPIAASHPYEVTLSEGGLVEFTFANILLPDSTTNEVLSHGFFKYRIQPLDGLAENTAIENTADIFFDFNPAIQTNTTLNTLVSMLPTNTTSIQKSIYVEAFPNPFSKVLHFSIGVLPSNNQLMLTLRNANGQLIQTYSITSNEVLRVEEENLLVGLYFYELLDKASGDVWERGKVVKQ